RTAGSPPQHRPVSHPPGKSAHRDGSDHRESQPHRPRPLALSASSPRLALGVTSLPRANRLMHLPTFVRSIANLGARLVTELRGPELRHSTITLTGSLGRFALGFVTSVMLARLLGPSGYGLIALVSLVLSIVDTLGD